MVTELRNLLEQSVTYPPEERHSSAEIVRRARVRTRRGRVVAGASALTVLAVAGFGYGAVHGIGSPPVHPALRTAPVGPVVHLEDATPATEGDQYRVTTSYPNQNLDAGNGRLFVSVTTDGRVLVSDAVRHDPNDAMSEYNRYGLVDPATGDTSWLPDPPDAVFATDHAPSGPSVLLVQDDRVLWWDRERSPARIDVYDLGSHAWAHLDLDLTKLLGQTQANMLDLRGVALWKGRMYFVPDDAAGGAAYTGTLWSVPLDGSSAPQKVATVGDWAIDGSTLVYSDRYNDPVSTVTVLDLATGEEHSFDPKSGDTCNQLSLALAAGRIALTEYCGTHAGVRDDRVHVVSTDGAPLVTLQADGLDTSALGDGFFTATGYDGADAPAGTYVYDFASRTLSRISEGAAKYSPGSAAGGSTLTWSTPLNGGHGMKIWAGHWG